MAERSPHLLGFAFGIFHAAALLLALVALLAGSEAGAEPLADVGTGAGIAIGLWLAALSCGATFWALKGLSLTALPPTPDLAGRVGLAGFVAGALFLAGVLLALPIVEQRFEPPLLIVVLFASPFAGGSGTVIALALACVDVLVFMVARSLVLRGPV